MSYYTFSSWGKSAEEIWRNERKRLHKPSHSFYQFYSWKKGQSRDWMPRRTFWVWLKDLMLFEIFPD